jgi:hypothetical protein
VDSHGRDNVVRSLLRLIEDDDADLADAAVSKLQGLCLGAEAGTVDFLRRLGHSNEEVRLRATRCLCTIDASNARCFIWALHNLLTGGMELFIASAYVLRRTFDGMPWGTTISGLLCVGKIIEAKSAVPERDRSVNQENSPRRA